MRLFAAPAALLLSAVILMLTSCSGNVGEPASGSATDILVSVGDSVLTRAAVEAQIPRGLSPADSTRMFDAIVENWLERTMLVNMAGGNIPDIDKIDRMVEQYRLQLLANEYRAAMARDHAAAVSQDSVRAYYEANPQEFMLSAPLLKGIYLKIAADAPQLAKVRGWMASAKSDDIDALETDGLKGALEYDYFGDSWINWSEIAERIPYRFGDADEFIAARTMFETSAGGAVYMLRILDYIPSGELMPFETAKAEIAERVMDRNRDAYDRSLLRSLYTRGLKDKTVKTGSYTPIKYRQ